MQHHTEALKKTIDTVEDLNALVTRVQKARESSKDFRSKILLTEEETASLLHVSQSFLRENRYKGVPPVYYKLGSVVRYDYFELMDYLDSCRRHSTSEGTS